MRIDVFERPDGSIWADYQQPPRADRKIIATHEASTRGDIERIVATPGEVLPGRVRALAQRALQETIAASKPKERSVDAGYVDMLQGRGFIGRAKWLFTGR